MSDLPGFQFFQFGTATKSVYSTLVCPVCRLGREQRSPEIWSPMVLNPLLIVPFPTQGKTLEDIVKQEFETENGISFDCQHGACGAKNIGTKSKTTMLLQCPYSLIVSVTRRVQGTDDRIHQKIELGNQSSE